MLRGIILPRGGVSGNKAGEFLKPTQSWGCSLQVVRAEHRETLLGCLPCGSWTGDSWGCLPARLWTGDSWGHLPSGSWMGDSGPRTRLSSSRWSQSFSGPCRGTAEGGESRASRPGDPSLQSGFPVPLLPGVRLSESVRWPPRLPL